jgi:hypothetical protein
VGRAPSPVAGPAVAGLSGSVGQSGIHPPPAADPFRHYERVPVLDLPADPPAPETPALEVLHAVSGTTPAADGPTFLSQLLFYSAAISASKRVPSTGYRYALRVNPSSGNLHPTEFHFLTRSLKAWPDGLYHYRPSAHISEPPGRGDAPPAYPKGHIVCVSRAGGTMQPHIFKE